MLRIEYHVRTTQPELLPTLPHRFYVASQDAEGEEAGLAKLAEQLGVPKPKSRMCDICLTKHACYALAGEKAHRCVEHKDVGMVNVISKTCDRAGCTVQPCYAKPGEKAHRCVEHKDIGMVNVISKTCDRAGCMVQPAYAKPGEKPHRCGEHKDIGMVDVKNKTCDRAGCTVQPVYAKPGEKAHRCVEHKDVGMVNVKSKTCDRAGCTVIPIYAKPGEKAHRCGEHKDIGMVNVKDKTCDRAGCTVIPNYAKPGEKAHRCGEHKDIGMVNVKSKTCDRAGCTTGATYGLPGHQPTKCAQHKDKGMMFRPSKKCVRCPNPAYWGKNGRLYHCEDHKHPDERNMVEQRCLSCGLLYLLSADGFCECCKPEAFLRAKLQKQNALMAFLDANGCAGDSTDRVIDGGECGKERPDRVFDFGDKVVIVECDENQHKDRQCACEQTRMVNIGQSLGGVPVCFVRFNPDGYAGGDETLLNRYKLLVSLLSDLRTGVAQVPSALVSVVYLYFDGWQGYEAATWQALS